MSTMYNIIEELCNLNGITITQMCRDLKINRSSLSELKQGRAKSLSVDKVIKIADYFEVSVNYIMGLSKEMNENKSESKPTNNDIKSAIFNTSDNITDEMLEEVKQFAELVKLREENKRKYKITHSKNDDEIDVFIAARSEGNTEIPKNQKMKKSEWERLNSLPDTDDDF